MFRSVWAFAARKVAGACLGRCSRFAQVHTPNEILTLNGTGAHVLQIGLAADLYNPHLSNHCYSQAAGSHELRPLGYRSR
jgi:hypothetical protein